MEPEMSKEQALDHVSLLGLPLDSVPEEYRADKDVVLAAVKADGAALEYASAELRADRDVVLAAVKADGEALQFASERLRGDKEVVLAAIVTGSCDESSDGILEYASEQLRGDSQFVLTVFREILKIVVGCEKGLHLAAELQHASEELKGDKGFMLEVVRMDGMALEHASQKLRGDREVALEAVKESWEAFECVSEELRASQDFLLLVVRAQPKLAAPPTIFQYSEASRFASRRRPVIDSSLAVQGETSPILSITLTSEVGEAPDPAGSVAAGRSYSAEVSLMSGATFVCTLEDEGAKRRVTFVNDLARKVVEELPKRTEITDAERVFINFRINEDGDAVAVSPWDWNRPLLEFLYAPSKGGEQEPPPKRQRI